MVKHAGQVQIIVALRKYGGRIVRFNGDEDAGLYIPRFFRNNFGTSLACRGTVAELEAFMRGFSSSRRRCEITHGS